MMSLQKFQTFFFKSKCKFCKTGPKNIYYIFNKYFTQNNFANIQDFDKNIIESKIDEVFLENSIKHRKFKPSYIFDSNLISNGKLAVDNINYEQDKDKLNTVFECNCGRTSWALLLSKRKHIANRKCGVVLNIKELLYSTEYRILINA